MKCFYCDRDGEGLNPYNHKYYCKDHALKKMNDYIKEFNQHESNTLKDGFIKIIEDDPNLINVTLNTLTGNVINASNNRK